MPIGIARIDRVVAGIGIAVGADAGVGDVPPIGLEERRGSENPPGEGFPEAREFGVVVAGVEELQPGTGVIALADVALRDLLFGGGDVGVEHIGFAPVEGPKGG